MCAKKAVKKVQLVLKEQVSSLGKAGEVVTVRRGYADNYLIPQGLGAIATQDVLDAIAQKQREAEAAAEELRAQARKVATAMSTVGSYVIKKKVNDSNELYDSVTARDLIECIHAQLPDLGLNEKLADEDVAMPEVKGLGTFTANVTLAEDVNGLVEFAVIASK